MTQNRHRHPLEHLVGAERIVLDAAKIEFNFEHTAEALTPWIVIDAGQLERLKIVDTQIL